MKRREFLKAAGAATTLAAAGCASTTPSKARVVVIGGGFGGATAAKYIRMWDPAVDVVLVEREPAFISCPISNLVLAGFTGMDDITRRIDGLERHGVRVVRDEAVAIDAAKKTVRLRHGEIAYERLVVSPGIDFTLGDVQGYEQAMQAGRVLHAWKAGPQTVALRRQLEQMRDGGVYVLSIPLAPYRCPPGPYERASVIAAYFKRAKPRSKVLILDANPDVTSKGALFKKAWSELYPGMVEYRPQHKTVAVDAATRTVKFEVQQDVRADVLNVLPPMHAGQIALQSGLANSNARWCNVHWQSFESTAARHIHVVGDSIQHAAGMPKSGHMANSHAKVAAAAVVAELLGLESNPQPVLNNTCYSFVGEDSVIHVASVHEYVAAEKTFKPVAGSGGVSAERSALEARYALSWARNIWADTLG